MKTQSHIRVQVDLPNTLMPSFPNSKLQPLQRQTRSPLQSQRTKKTLRRELNFETFLDCFRVVEAYISYQRQSKSQVKAIQSYFFR